MSLYEEDLFEVPNEVADSDEAIKIDFNIGGNSYSYNVVLHWKMLHIQEF